MKSKAIECISELIYQTTWRPNPHQRQKAYENRIKGFRAEALAPIDLGEAKGYKSYKGGWIIPLEKKKRFRETDEVLYITALSRKEYSEYNQQYIEIYSKLEQFKYKYIAVYEIDFNESMTLLQQFTHLEFPKIKIDYYKFKTHENIFVESTYEKIVNLNKKELKNNFGPQKDEVDKNCLSILEELTEESLNDILVDRFIFDYLLGNKFFEKGVPADFDMIVSFPELDNLYVIYEIKEKDLSKENNNPKNVVGFGMDTERINDYQVFSEWFPSFHFRYIVRQIDNQTDRNFVNWRSIGMKLFIEKATEDPDGKSGGQGMSPSNDEDKNKQHFSTAICPDEAFRIINFN